MMKTWSWLKLNGKDETVINFPIDVFRKPLWVKCVVSISNSEQEFGDKSFWAHHIEGIRALIESFFYVSCHHRGKSLKKLLPSNQKRFFCSSATIEIPAQMPHTQRSVFLSLQFLRKLYIFAYQSINRFIVNNPQRIACNSVINKIPQNILQFTKCP